MGQRAVVVLVVALAAAALVAREGGSPDVGARLTAPLPAVTEGEWLVRLDPRSLKPVSDRRVRLREPVLAWARSGSHLAVAGGSALRFFDLGRMRALGRLDYGKQGLVAALAWPRRDLLWLVVANPGCCATGSTTVLAVDPVRRRVVARHHLRAGLARVAATEDDGVVLLLAPPSTIGTAALATVDPDDRVHRVPLPGVSAGLQPTEGVPFVLRGRQPGLAVGGGRAYIVTSRPQVVEVDLRDRRVRYHRLTAHRSLLERVRDLLEPPAEAQGAVGPVRSAAWLTAGLIAVSGSDTHASWRPRGGVEPVDLPAGLQLIDTRRWEVRTLDEHAAGFRVADGYVVTDGNGLTVHRGGESDRFLEGRRVELVGSAGSLAYVREGRTLLVVDLASGRVLTSDATPPRLLLERRGPWG